MARHLVVLLVAATAAVALIGGCGEKECPSPVCSVIVSPNSLKLEIGQTASLAAKVVGERSGGVNWYVNGVLGGNAGFGAITQTNPAIYTAPNHLPLTPVQIVVEAIACDDTSKAGNCLVNLSFTRIYVDCTAGNDETGTGCISLPFKSITHGLAVARSGMTVSVAPGVYDLANREVFPIHLPDSVALVGEDWERTIVRGHGRPPYVDAVFDIFNAACALRKLTIEPGSIDEDSLRFGIAVGGVPGVVIDSIRMLGRPSTACIFAYETPDLIIENCHLVIGDGQQITWGIASSWLNSGTVIRNCSVSGFREGIYLNGASDALVEGCTVAGNWIGVELCCENESLGGLNPDLGGGVRGSAGGNSIRNNLLCGLHNPTRHALVAKFNTWTHNPPVANEDYCVDGGTGSVIWQ